MAVNTTWSDPTATQANSGLALVTGDTLTQDSWQRTVSNLNALGSTTGRRVAYRREWLKGSDIASATTTDLSTVEGNYAHVTGTTSITAFGTVNSGTIMVLEFDSALTVTYNATTLMLAGNANFVTAAGDILVLVSEGSGNWREIARTRRLGNFKLLTIERDLTAASGAVNTAHGIGATPKAAIIFAIIEAGSYGRRTSFGFSDGTVNYALRSDDTNTNLKTANCVWITNATDTDNQKATATFDATNLTLTWTKTGSPASTGELIVLLLF